MKRCQLLRHHPNDFRRVIGRIRLSIDQTSKSIAITTSRKVGRPFDICGRKVSKSLGPQVIWYADEDRCIGEMLPKSRTYQIACPISFRFRSSWTTEKFECESRQRSLRQKEKHLEPD